MSLASNAIIDVDYYLRYIGVDVDDANVDTTITEQLINQASTSIESLCHRKFRSGSASDIFNGDGKTEYWVTEASVTAKPTIYYWDGDSWETLSASTYDWTYTSTGRVYFTDGNGFSEGIDNWKIDYTYGYALADIPQDVKLACAMLVQFCSMLRSKAGKSSENFGDQSTSYDFVTPPKIINQLLAPYKVIPCG